MTTTAVALATTERPAMGRPGTAKPAGQPSAVPGQFAALMLQADEEVVAPDASETAATELTPTDKNNAETETASINTPGADTAQLALQALLDWRSQEPNKSTEPSSSTSTPDTPKTLWLAASAQQLKPTRDAEPQGPLALQTNWSPGKSCEGVVTLPPGMTTGTPGDADKFTVSKTSLDAAANPTAQVPTMTPGLPRPTADVNAAVQAMGKGKPNPTNKTGSNMNGHPAGAANGETAPSAVANGTTKPPEPTDHVRSTVDLANRGPGQDNSSETRAPERSETLEPRAIESRTGHGSPMGDGTQQALMADAGGTAAPTGSTAASAPESFPGLLQAQMDEVGSQISYWSAQGAQRASFTVGSAQDMPVEVILSFTDGALDVAFETEEDGVRDLLENQAHEALQQLMDAQGIVLGEVSVGGGRSQAQRDSGNEGTTLDIADRGQNRKPAVGSAATPTAARRAPEIMTATKIDLYA